MGVPFFRPVLGKKTKDYVEDAVDAMWFSGGYGEYYALLKEYLSQTYNRKYCILVNSGTSACRAALAAAKASNTKRVNKVVIPRYSCSADIMPVFEQRSYPVFTKTDVFGNPFIPNFRSSSVFFETYAFMCPFIYGTHPNYLQDYADACQYNRTVLISDISQAVTGKPVSLPGDFLIGSLRTEKFFGCGEGGFILTDDEALYSLAYHFCTRGKQPGEYYVCNAYGDNLLMPGVTAAIAWGQLDILPSVVSAKQKAVSKYLQSTILRQYGTFAVRQFENAPWQLMFVINTDIVAARVLIRRFSEAGIETRPGFYPLSHIWQHYMGRDIIEDLRETDLNAFELYNYGVVLPTPYGLTDKEVFDIEQVVKTVCG